MSFVNDTMTDTAGVLLSAHTGEAGATWTLHPSYSSTAQITDANRLRLTSTGSAAYYASGVPASADYDVQCTVRQVDPGSGFPNEANGVAGRIDTVANTMYFARWHDFPTVEWELFKIVAGTSTSLGAFADSMAVNVDHTLKLEMRGSAINLYADGVLKIGATDSAITLAGRAGVRLTYSLGTVDNAHGLQLDSFLATDAVRTLLPQVRTRLRAVARAAYY